MFSKQEINKFRASLLRTYLKRWRTPS